MTNRFDEINQIDKVKVITEYFDEMELDDDEKGSRVKLALELEDLFERLFLLALAMWQVGNIEQEYLIEYLATNYGDIVDVLGYDTVAEYIVNRIADSSSSIVKTTEQYIADEYYTSVERAIICAETETNAIANYQMEQNAIKQGFKYKRWTTMLDRKVRKTHVMADGQEVEIQKPFNVGGYEMMFPLDQSLGAHAKECINCRCVATYIK